MWCSTISWWRENIRCVHIYSVILPQLEWVHVGKVLPPLKYHAKDTRYNTPTTHIILAVTGRKEFIFIHKFSIVTSLRVFTHFLFLSCLPFNKTKGETRVLENIKIFFFFALAAVKTEWCESPGSLWITSACYFEKYVSNKNRHVGHRVESFQPQKNFSIIYNMIHLAHSPGKIRILSRCER